MTSHQVNDVFDAFVAAKAAIDKVPELERQIDALSVDLSIAREIIELYKVDLAKAHNERDTAKAAYSAAEEALDTCRKSEADTASRLDLLISTLRDLGGNIGAALSVVTPEPEPVVEAPAEVVSVPSDPTPTVDATAASPSPTATNATPADPIPDSSYEATRQELKGWFDIDNYFHRGVVHDGAFIPEAKVESPVPFAPLTAESSPVATLAAPIFTTAHRAALSGGVSLIGSPDDI